MDRVTGILETVSLSPRGMTLAELAAALGAAKTSILELTNGLLARLPHRGGAPVPPGSGAVHHCLAQSHVVLTFDLAKVLSPRDSHYIVRILDPPGDAQVAELR